MFFSSKKIIDDIPQIDINAGNINMIQDYVLNTNDENTIKDFKFEVIKDDIIKDDIIKEEEKDDNEEEEVNDEEEEEEDYDTDDSELRDEDDCLFIVTIDDVPSYYDEKLADAKNRIDRVSKLYSLNDNGYHETHIKYVSETEIDIIRNYDFWLFAINHVMHTFKIYKIKKLI
jgi:hypothetical protein